MPSEAVFRPASRYMIRGFSPCSSMVALERAHFMNSPAPLERGALDVHTIYVYIYCKYIHISNSTIYVNVSYIIIYYVCIYNKRET